MKKILTGIFVFILALGSVVFADGAPDYRLEVFTVVVSNPLGAKCYDELDMREESYSNVTFSYGEIITVEKTSDKSVLLYSREFRCLWLYLLYFNF